LEFGGVTIVRDLACTVQGDGLQVCKTEYPVLCDFAHSVSQEG